MACRKGRPALGSGSAGGRNLSRAQDSANDTLSCSHGSPPSVPRASGPPAGRWHPPESVAAA